MSAEDRNVILTAESARDIKVKVRNKLYAAIARTMTRPSASLNMVEEWQKAQDSGNQEAKFSFLKKFAHDTSGGDLNIWEKVTKSAESYNDEKYMWVTKFDLFSGVRLLTW